MKKTKKYAMGGLTGGGLEGIKTAVDNTIGAINNLNSTVVGDGSPASSPSFASGNVNPVGGKTPLNENLGALKVGGYKKGGMVSSASKRGDGCAQRGKTRGRMV